MSAVKVVGNAEAGCPQQLCSTASGARQTSLGSSSRAGFKLIHPPPPITPPGTWRAFDETLSPRDPLEFVDMKPYPDRVRDSQDKTGMNDAIRTGTGTHTHLAHTHTHTVVINNNSNIRLLLGVLVAEAAPRVQPHTHSWQLTLYMVGEVTPQWLCSLTE